MNMKCLQCGRCCRWDGFVWLQDSDFNRLATNITNGDVELFKIKYCTIHILTFGFRYKLKDKSNGECVFLTDNKCSIHDFQPEQCNTTAFKDERCLANIAGRNDVNGRGTDTEAE